MSKFAYVMSVLVLFAPPAIAQNTGQTAQAEAVPSKDKSDVNRIVCKREDKVGSRLAAKKVCLTVQEWNERAAQDRDETSRVQRDTQLGTPVG